MHSRLYVLVAVRVGVGDVLSMLVVLAAALLDAELAT